jgi:hypothetical protein
MNFLVDAQLPPALARLITSLGHNAVHVEEAGAAIGHVRDRGRKFQSERASHDPYSTNQISYYKM